MIVVCLVLRATRTNLSATQKVLPSPFLHIPTALLVSTLAIRWLPGHLDQCWCGSLPACMIWMPAGTRHRKAVALFFTVCCGFMCRPAVCGGAKQVHVRVSGLCEPNCKSTHLATEPLSTGKQFRCGCVVALQNLKILLSWIVWRGSWSPFWHP